MIHCRAGRERGTPWMDIAPIGRVVKAPNHLELIVSVRMALVDSTGKGLLTPEWAGEESGRGITSDLLELWDESELLMGAYRARGDLRLVEMARRLMVWERSHRVSNELAHVIRVLKNMPLGLVLKTPVDASEFNDGEGPDEGNAQLVLTLRSQEGRF